MDNFEELAINQLASDAYWVVNKQLAKSIGIDSAIFMADLLAKYKYFRNRNELKNGKWFYNTISSIENDCSFKKDKQFSIIDNLKAHNLIEIKVMDQNPPKRYFSINFDTLYAIISTDILKTRKWSFSEPDHNNKNKQYKNKKESSIEDISDLSENPLDLKNPKMEITVKTELKPLKSIEMHNFVQELLKEWPYKHNLPDFGQPITKVIARIERIIMEMLNNQFNSRLYPMDSKFIEKNKIDLSAIKPDLLKRNKLLLMIKKSIFYYKKALQADYTPINKKNMPKNLDIFLYDSWNKTSYFLQMTFNRPIEATKYRGNINCDKIKNALPDKEKACAQEFLNKHPSWNEGLFWNKTLEIYQWLQDNKEYLQNKNTAYHATCQSLRQMLDRISEFESTWNSFNIGNYGVNNKTWNLFSEYLLKKYKVNIYLKGQKNNNKYSNLKNKDPYDTSDTDISFDFE